MASRVRVVDCPACGASEFVLRIIAESFTRISCSDCGFALCEVRGLGFEPNTEQNCRAFVAPVPS